MGGAFLSLDMHRSHGHGNGYIEHKLGGQRALERTKRPSDKALANPS